MSDSADIVVIGAGVIGTSIAFHLAELGAGRILVLDRAHVAAGMSARSSALVRMHYTCPQEVRLAVLSRDMFERWQELTGAETTFRKCGFVRLVAAEDTERLRRNAAMQRAQGSDIELVTAAELREIEPDWQLDDVELAGYEPASGYGDGATTAGDLLTAARRRGARYVSNTSVKELLCRDTQVTGVRTHAGEIHAPMVVCAAGAWSVPLLEAVGVSLPIVTEYHHTLDLSRPPRSRGVRTACIDSANQCYFRPQQPDRTLLGEFGGPRGGDPDSVPRTPSQGTLARLLGAVVRRVPVYADAGVVHTVAGVYDMTPDLRPLLGPVPGITGLYLAAGFSGTGFKISPAVGRCMAEWILEGAPRSVDVSVFRLSRFAEGELVVAADEYASDHVADCH